VVLIGASRSGKTSLSEAMLYEGKVIDRRGSVEEKNTVSDNTEFEQTNQKSINATPLYGEINGCKVTLSMRRVLMTSAAVPLLLSRLSRAPSW
jgi:Translation elongation factors (GTPases)